MNELKPKRRVDLRSSAPGNLILFGEWTVLFGGKAIGTAIDRRLYLKYGSETEGVRPSFRKALSRNNITAALEAVELDRCRFELSELEKSGQSLGLGTSAASLVNLHGIEKSLSSPNDPDRKSILRDSLKSHRRLQDGWGSGLDLATSTFGGTILFQNGHFDAELQLQPEEGSRLAPGIEPLSVPESLRVVPIWTGMSASTSEMLNRFRETFQKARRPIVFLLEQLNEKVEEAIELFETNSIQHLSRIVEDIDLYLDRLGRVANIPIATEAHHQIREAADELEIAVKPSGAGGGDFSLAFGLPDSNWEQFRTRLPREARIFDFEFSSPGLQIKKDV